MAGVLGRTSVAKHAKQARMAKTKLGRKPVTNGWFVLNAKDSVWYGNGVFGAFAPFESRKAPFTAYGINIHVLQPGVPNCHYHGESEQEDFLVLSGRCRLLIEGKEIPLKAWDFVHCPPWTDHVFVGAGKMPCVILMAGARGKSGKVHYPRSPLALKYKAGVEKPTNDPRVSYAKVPRSAPVPTPAPFGGKSRGAKSKRR